MKVHKDWLPVIEKIIFTREFFEAFKSGKKRELLERLPRCSPCSVSAVLLTLPEDAVARVLASVVFTLDASQRETKDLLRALLLQAQHATLFASEKLVPKLRELLQDDLLYGFRQLRTIRNEQEAADIAAELGAVEQ